MKKEKKNIYPDFQHLKMTHFQGLFEYVRPAWEARPRPAAVDLDLKTFGATLPARPTLGNSTDSEKNVPQ